MPFKVFLTADATRDLEELYQYLSGHESPDKAAFVLNKIENVLDNLSIFPDRGSYPKELLALGIRDYREIFLKPYRLIYRVLNQKVYIYIIADGRRDMQALLKRRLLEG